MLPKMFITFKLSAILTKTRCVTCKVWSSTLMKVFIYCCVTFFFFICICSSLYFCHVFFFSISIYAYIFKPSYYTFVCNDYLNSKTAHDRPVIKQQTIQICLQYKLIQSLWYTSNSVLREALFDLYTETKRYKLQT